MIYRFVTTNPIPDKTRTPAGSRYELSDTLIALWGAGENFVIPSVVEGHATITSFTTDDHERSRGIASERAPWSNCLEA
jgi:hypothetical protein